MFSIKILVDGDGCGKISKIENIAKSFKIECHIYVNSNCGINPKYGTLHISDCSKNAADFAIINNCSPSDIVVTNDSGLAAMVLAKNAVPLTTHGIIYTKENIMEYLNSRYIRNREFQRTKHKRVRHLPINKTEKPFGEVLASLISGSI